MTSATQKLDDIRLAMAKTNRLFETEVVGKRNYAALDQIYTASARILPPGAPMAAGRVDIVAFWKAALESLNVVGGGLRTVDVMPAGEGIVEIGAADLEIDPQGTGATRVSVKYVVYWLQEDGAWRWHVDIWNMNA